MHQDMYEETFVSTLVSQKKSIHWEIKNIESILREGCENAMNIEFEMGKLGHIQTHLPRKSRWRLSIYKTSKTGNLSLRLRTQLLWPDNRVVLYRNTARILKGSHGKEIPISGEPPTVVDSLRLGLNQSENSSTANSISIICGPLADKAEDVVRHYVSPEGSLFLKIVMEVFEDSSSYSN